MTDSHGPLLDGPAPGGAPAAAGRRAPAGRPSRRSQRGQVLVIMGVLMVGIMGLTGLVTDIGTYFYQNRVQQNAAEAASQAATTYWAGRLATATDQDLYCMAQMYASSSAYGSLSSQCPASTGSIPDNHGQGVRAYYVDFTGNQLGPVGQLGAVRPLVTYPAAAGIRVTTSATSGAFFSRIFNISGFAVNDAATYRVGTVAGVTNPRSGTGVFPAVFQLTAYNAAPRYPPTATPVMSQVQNFGGLPCSATSAFCWSGLQCTVSNGNDITQYWLSKGTNPCPSAPTLLATATSSLCTSVPQATQASCAISVDPGTRDVDFSLTQQNWTNGIAIVPIINGTNSAQPIVQFAYIYITGTGGSGSGSYVSGYFIDPSLMPPLPTVLSGPCTTSANPCGVTGTA